jgi:hypothetical protein
MPKATVDKDAHTAARKYQIGLARQVTLMQPEAKALPVQEAAYCQLRRRVAAADAAHIPAARFRTQLIHWFCCIEVKIDSLSLG